MGLSPMSWWDVLKILIVPVVAAFLRPPKREGVAFLWLFSTGVVVTLFPIMGQAPRGLLRLAFGMALLGIAWAMFRYARQLQRRGPTLNELN
jgi:hypothetical protein